MRSSSSARRPSLRRAAATVIETLECRRLLSGSAYTTQTIVDPAGEPFGTFGRGMATNGNLALIASPGVAGTSDSAATVGHVSLIDTSDNSVKRVFANPDPEEGDFFGNAVAFVGNKIAISAPENIGGGVGKVYVYDSYTDTNPLVIESPYPTLSSFPVFGATLAGYGGDLLVGVIETNNPGANGAIIRYDLDPSDGTNAPLYMYDSQSAGNDQLGSVLASDGNSIWSTSNHDGETVVVQLDGSGNLIRTISEPGDLADPANGFGSAIDVDGNTLVIGASSGNLVYQLDADDAELQNVFTLPEGSFAPFGGFGISVAINGDQVIVGSANALTPLDEFSGYFSGEAHVFSLTTGELVETLENPSPQVDSPEEGQVDSFGTAVAALPGGKFLVADPYDDRSGIDTGTVWLFAPLPTNVAPSNAQIASASSAVRNQAIAFTGSFSDPDAGDTHTVSWNFGDGNTAANAGLQVSHSYAAAGSYDVTMTVTDSANESTSVTVTVTVTATATSADGKTLYVGGTSGNDSVIIKKNNAGASSVTIGNDTATIVGGRIVVIGGDGDDLIDASATVSSALEIYGGNGNDTIHGGGTGDILAGGADNDVITGGKGRDLIIGGTGADRLNGDQDDDILIAGYTAHDGDAAALRSIQSTWGSSQSYTARVDALRGSLLRPNLDVFDDVSVDTLTGSGGTDWFIFNVDSGVKDIVTDMKKDEIATDI